VTYLTYETAAPETIAAMATNHVVIVGAQVRLSQHLAFHTRDKGVFTWSQGVPGPISMVGYVWGNAGEGQNIVFRGYNSDSRRAR